MDALARSPTAAGAVKWRLSTALGPSAAGYWTRFILPRKQGEIVGAIEPRSTLASTLAKPPFFPEIGTTSIDQLGHLIMLTAFVAQAILAEASLSFLGLGVQEPTTA
jgi:hypothetical protein